MTTKKKMSAGAKRICVLILAVLLFFFLSIILRVLTRQLLVKRMGIENSFTNAVLFDVHKLQRADDDGGIRTVKIDWEALYPFPDNADNTDLASAEPSVDPGVIAKYKNLVQAAKGIAESYATDYLVGYQKIVELAHKYEEILQWSYVPYAEYNGTIKLSDGHLTSFSEKKNTDSAADGISSLGEYCRQNDICFVYMQAPHKISEVHDTDLSGVVDFSNQNADALIVQLQKKNLDVYDFRDQIETEGLVHHDLFYRTDHHWRAETGLWASQHILQYFRQQYHFAVNPALLNPDQFITKLYPSWFLGSKGKKVTLSVAEPEDFTLLYPDYETELHLSIPDAGVDLDGSFSIMYNMEQINERDYYNKNPYAAFIYGDHAMTRIENKLADNDYRVLFIHDSFADCVIPFVSLGVKYTDALDPRHFTGSIRRFIEQTQPDAVVLLYSPNSIAIGQGNHTGPFDLQ